MYVVDASVWISGFLGSDVNHSSSSQWLLDVGQRRTMLAGPMILLAEVAGAISRRTADSLLAKAFVRRMESLPYTRFVDTDLGAGRRAATIAADMSLKGSDALYVALGVELDMQLVTWDNQQRRRGALLISVANPAELLSQTPP